MNSCINFSHVSELSFAPRRLWSNNCACCRLNCNLHQFLLHHFYCVLIYHKNIWMNKKNLLKKLINKNWKKWKKWKDHTCISVALDCCCLCTWCLSRSSLALRIKSSREVVVWLDPRKVTRFLSDDPEKLKFIDEWWLVVLFLLLRFLFDFAEQLSEIKFRIPTKAELEIFPLIDYSVQVKNKTKSLWNIPCHVSPVKNDNDGPTKCTNSKMSLNFCDVIRHANRWERICPL